MSQTVTSTGLKTTMIVRGQSLDVADLEIIKLESLIAKDKVEMARLLKAAESHGFFYVSFDKDLSDKISSHLQTSYQNSHEYFAKPVDEKMKDFRDDLTHGYKRAGIESFEVTRDEHHKIALPKPFAEHTLEFSDICNTIVRTILRSLSDSLGLGEPSGLEIAHRPDGKSDSGIKFVSGPTKGSLADVPDTTHTDSGSITLLWCEKWASQMQTRDSKEWLWIDPKPDCVLVNVANYLENETRGRLHSPVHRVSQPSDGVEDRYFVSYFLRPNN